MSDTHGLDHVKWAAWGVIDIDNGKMDRIQRRNYINKVRKELEPYKAILECGGSTRVPWYRIVISGNIIGKAWAGQEAFKRACAEGLKYLEPDAVHKEDAA